MLDREATIDKLERARRGGRRRRRTARSSSPRRSSPPTRRRSGRGRSPAGRAAARRRRSRCSPRVGGGARARRRTRIGAVAREHGVWMVTGVTEIDPERPVDALQHAPLPRTGRLARAQAPQARADEPRAPGLGPGRRRRAARDPDAARTARRADLLGELHAARALRPLRVGRRDLRRLDRRRRRRLAVDARPHRARVTRFVVAPSHFQRASSYPDDFPLRALLDGVETIGRGGSAVLAPDGAYLAGPLYDEEGILYAELDPARALGGAAAVRPGGPLPPAGRASA